MCTSLDWFLTRTRPSKEGLIPGAAAFGCLSDAYSVVLESLRTLMVWAFEVLSDLFA